MCEVDFFRIDYLIQQTILYSFGFDVCQ
jgi:hypothetical protein